MLRGGDLTSHMDGYNEAHNHVATNDHEFLAYPVSRGIALKQLYNVSAPEHLLLLSAVITLGVTSAVQLTTPYVTSQVIDSALSQQSDHTKLLGLLFAVMALASYLTYVRNIWQTRAAHSLAARLRKQAFQSIVSQDAEYFDSTSMGEILSHLTVDAEILQTALATQFMGTIRNVMMALGAGLLLLRISWSLAFLALSVLPPSMLLAKARSREMQRRNAKLQEAHAQSAARASQAIGGIRTVQQYTAEHFEVASYELAVDTAHQSAVQASKRQFQSVGVIQLLGNGSMMLVLAYGGHLVASGTLTAGNLAAFVMYSLLMAGNVVGISSAYLELSKAASALERILRVVEREPGIPKPTTLQNGIGCQEINNIEKRGGPISVSFQNVSFAYPSRSNVSVLQDFSLEIGAGQTLALVGYSGAGKSTISALLTRLYNIDSGKILVDGIDITTLPPQQVRGCIGVVSQEPVLFPTTIADNIRYGSFDADDQQVHQAAEAAHVWEFAQNLPNGLNTLVGPTQLSGGQKQRVAIARCLLKNFSLLILDEATSALDAESEHAVQKALEAACVGRTVIVIAHRLSSIQTADKIAVMEHGRVVETGTYRQLVELTDGYFRRLIERQLQDDS